MTKAHGMRGIPSVLTHSHTQKKKKGGRAQNFLCFPLDGLQQEDFPGATNPCTTHQSKLKLQSSDEIRFNSAGMIAQELRKSINVISIKNTHIHSLGDTGVTRIRNVLSSNDKRNNNNIQLRKLVDKGIEPMNP